MENNNNNDFTKKKHLIGNIALAIHIFTIIITILIYEPYGSFLRCLIIAFLILLVIPISLTVFLACYDHIK